MIERRLVTAGLKTLLTELTGRPVGVRTTPLDTEGRPVPPPYTLLYPLDHRTDDGTLADGHRTAVSDYQATFVSGPVPGAPDSRGGDEQAQWLADRGRRLVARPTDGSGGYAHPLNCGPGVGCYRRDAAEAGGTSEPNDAIITTVIRFRLYLETSA
ncbi:hypothetical protein [Streptomyces sp. Da 82-17]|uniref:hypothetical protein n=1 Tax=Streptomyces sp. Da 82-17 TaxID=3377116 RepID=UPI0038D45427